MTGQICTAAGLVGRKEGCEGFVLSCAMASFLLEAGSMSTQGRTVLRPPRPGLETLTMLAYREG